MRKSKKIEKYNKIRKESVSDNVGYEHRSHRTRKRLRRNDISEDYKRRKVKMIEDELCTDYQLFTKTNKYDIV